MLVCRKILRALLVLIAIVYFLAVGIMLGVRYFVIPHIDRWRPEIEAHLSHALAAQVHIEDISASWDGLHPALSLKQLKVSSDQGQPLLEVPSLYAVISWTTLVYGAPQFVALKIEDLMLSATQKSDGTVTVVGMDMPPLDPQQLNDPLNIPAIHWILSQPHIELNNASFVWIDETKTTQALRISDINVTVQNSVFTHEIQVLAQAPKELGGRLSFLMKADQFFSDYIPIRGRTLQLYAEIDRFVPMALRSWVNLPAVEGVFGARTWVEFRDGRLGETTLDIIGQGAAGSAGETDIRAEHFKVRLKGLFADMLPDVISPLLTAKSDHQRGIRVDGSLQGLELTTPLFDPNRVVVGQLDLGATVNWTKATGLQFDFNKLSVQNDQTQFDLKGKWHQGGALGLGFADISGVIQRLDVRYLHRYLPTLVGKEIRSWVKQSLSSGEFNQVQVKLSGDLSFFPFNDCGDFGQFRLDGQLNKVTLDYAPAKDSFKGWPMIEELDGRFTFERLGIDVNLQSAFVKSGGKDRVRIKSVSAKVADLYYDPLLHLQLDSVGSGQAYIDTLLQTPLADRFGEGLADVKLTGSLNVPIDLTVNLVEPSQIDVKGSVLVQNDSLSLSKDLPPVKDLSGRVDFAGDTVTFSDVQGQMLDGKILVDGSFDHDNGVVNVSGELGADWINSVAGILVPDLVQGRLKYKGTMKLNPSGGIDTTVNSNLKGLTLNLPGPFAKTAEQEIPVSLKFQGSRKSKDQRKTLSFNYGSNFKVQLEHTSSRRDETMFSRGVIAYDQPVVLPEKGLAIGVTLPTFDWDNWQVLTTATKALSPSDKSDAKPFFPPLYQARLLTRQLVFGDIGLTEVDLKMGYKNSSGNQLSAILSSRETDAIVDWTPADRTSPGKVVATLSHVVLGTAAEVVKTDNDPEQEQQSSSEPKADDTRYSDIPAIDLTIDDLTLYGNKLGRLRFIGSNQERGRKWIIEQLQIVNPYATLDASGSLQISTTRRGVTLNSKINISDLEKLSDFMGYPDRVKDGAGLINADIEWRNFPWELDFQGLSGNAEMALKNGVFQHLSSRSARLLELLSVQSLQRLFSLNFKPGTVFQNGYPWNSIKGKFQIKEGVLNTEDLTVASPVADILLTGKSDLKQRVWDMQADVKPIFDMSGTALATSIVVNPFVGLGALVTQFILRNPIEKALTAQYKVTGPWDDPKLEPLELERPSEKAVSPGH